MRGNMRKKRLNDWHHRRPSSRKGRNTEENLIQVNRDSHKSWHHLFRNYHPEVICNIINRIWLDPDFKFICKKLSKK